MKMSQYDYRMYQDELQNLQDEMTDLLIEMELRHAESPSAFEKWWNEEGNMRHYFDLKGRAEQVEQTLFYAEIEETEQPKMRVPGIAGGGRRKTRGR